MTKEFLSMRMENKYSGDINVDKSSSRESMDAYKDNWSACLLYRNKQLTRQLGDYQKVTALDGCSSSLMVAMLQLFSLHQKPAYRIVRDEAEWHSLFIVIDLLYGGCLLETLASFCLSAQELRLCYLIRARLTNKTIALLFNITPRSVLKSKQRIKLKLSLSGSDSFDRYIQQC